jgi:hypothetical protein
LIMPASIKRGKTPSKRTATAKKETSKGSATNSVMDTAPFDMGDEERCFLFESWGDLLTDPTFVFFIFCAIVPALQEGNPLFFLKFCLSPLMVICYFLTYAVWKWAHNGDQVKLTKAHRRAAMWYLINGIVFHFLMDFAVGTLKWDHGDFGVGNWRGTDTLQKNYFLMDKRYGCVESYMEASSEKCPEEAGYVAILTWIEVVDALFCFLVFRAYVQNLPSRAPLEIALCSSHFIGTVMFIGAEWWDGMHNTPRYYPIGQESGKYKFLGSKQKGFQDQMAYFYFAFLLCNPVWLIVPVIYGRRAYNEVTRAMEGFGIIDDIDRIIKSKYKTKSK